MTRITICTAVVMGVVELLMGGVQQADVRHGDAGTLGEGWHGGPFGLPATVGG